MMNRIASPDYWIEEFKPSPDELSGLVAWMLEHMRAASTEELAGRLITVRVQSAQEAKQDAASGKGTPYVPSDRYKKGQTLVFPVLEGAEGKVVTVREGRNPLYGEFEVIEVDVGGDTREFAAGISWDHELTATQADLNPDELVDRYASVIAPQLRERLSTDKEWVSNSDRWILRGLLPDVNAGHRNLAEAILMLANEPQPVERLLDEIDIDDSMPEDARRIALEMALEDDSRFRNVGAIESPLWTLDAQS